MLFDSRTSLTGAATLSMFWAEYASVYDIFWLSFIPSELRSDCRNRRFSLFFQLRNARLQVR
jgi:hypothetical protein